MAGRNLLDGKDAGIFTTYTPGRTWEASQQMDLLRRAGARQGRMIVEGVISCPVPMAIRVSQYGQVGGSAQLLSIDGREVSAIGANTGKSASSNRLQLAKGDHLIQWICDFDGDVNPRIDLVDESRAVVPRVRFTKQQGAAAKKGTKSEITISN